MKKIVSFLALVAFALVLTGCGKSKVLKCEIDQSSQLYGQGTMKANLDFHFKGDSLEKAVIKFDINITSSSLKESDMAVFETYLQSVCTNGLSGIKLSKCDVKLDGKRVTLDATAMKSDFPDKNDTYGSITETKKALVAQGYNCTIK